ncbi:SIS domain-containing protein [Ruegeria arenilitoris]|uniref:SIS domain-containing protein n=1 Tax=Ruegeria arenilitoris TaxID=1173585 RepID=UPI00147A21DA|nr:SIS domain-containing protein [Ruegeria arenilitoris]
MTEAFDRAISELASVAREIDHDAIETACRMICEARRVVLYGCGREGLQMKGFAMRLFHLGFDVSVQGSMTTPPVGVGDLFLVSDGPGRLATVNALTDIARSAGTKVVLFTAEPDTKIASKSDCTVAIRAQTMASDQGSDKSLLPMGSVYEGALFLLFEIMVLRLCDLTQADSTDIRARHTNLE